MFALSIFSIVINRRRVGNEIYGRVIQRDEFVLPDSDIKRNIIVVEKEQFTPKMYPRKAGLPAKEPIIKR